MPTKQPPRADLIEKSPTALQERFAAYIEKQTGYAPDMTTLVLFQSLRTPYQRSPENRADLERRTRKPGAVKATPSKSAVEQAKAVERGELPSGSVVVKATGERSMATAAKQPVKKAPAKRAPRKPTAKAS